MRSKWTPPVGGSGRQARLRKQRNAKGDRDQMQLTLLVLNLGAPDQDTHGCVLLGVGVLKVEIKLAGVLKGHEHNRNLKQVF